MTRASSGPTSGAPAGVAGAGPASSGAADLTRGRSTWSSVKRSGAASRDTGFQLGKPPFYGPRPQGCYHSIEGCPSLAIGHDASRTVRIRGCAEAAGELIRDRAHVVGVLLEEQSASDERDGRARRQLA